MILPASPYFWLSVITIGATATFFSLIGFALFVGKRNIDRDRKSFPKFTLAIITTFYNPIRLLLRKFGKDDRIVQRIGVDLYNHLAEERYSKVPAGERIVVIPHCLRDINCPAKTDPIAGILCVKCNKCGIGPFITKAEEHGVKTYVVNGSSFVKRVVIHYQPKGVYGVACTRDLFEVEHAINSRGIPMVGNLLMRDGCVGTDVDWDSAMKKFTIGLPPIPSEMAEAAPETPAVEPATAETEAEA